MNKDFNSVSEQDGLTQCLGGHRGANEQDWRHLWRKIIEVSKHRPEISALSFKWTGYTNILTQNIKILVYPVNLNV